MQCPIVTSMIVQAAESKWKTQVAVAQLMPIQLQGWQTKIETKGGASQSYNYDAQGNVTGICDGQKHTKEVFIVVEECLENCSQN